MKRIAYHPQIHPALPWCVVETEFPCDEDSERFPKVGVFATRDAAQAAHPDAVVDSEFTWECGLKIVPSAER